MSHNYADFGETMLIDEELLDEVEQRKAAERILWNVLRLVFDHPGVASKQTAAMIISAASTERERHGDFRAAALLRKWTVIIESWQ